MIEFDTEKDRRNRAQHGLGLTLGAMVLTDPFIIERLDAVSDQGEERWVATGMAAGTAYVVVYTMRGDRVRLISVRRATNSEAAGYLKNRAGGGFHDG